MSTPSTNHASAAPDVPRSATMAFDDGTSAVAEYYGDPSLFGMTHVPASPNGMGVVVASPVLNDFLKNNRREVLLGRRLAQLGFVVHRFHYAGSGSSDGGRFDMSTMIRDTQAAAAHLTTVHGVGQVAYLGTRLAAIPAVVAASQTDAPVALWEPVDGAAYFRDLFRTLAIAQMGGREEDMVPLSDIRAEFERTRVLDGGGFSVSWDFYESSNQSIPDVMGDGRAPVFLAQFRLKPELKAGYRKLVDSWESSGRKVSIHHVTVDEAWMLFVYGFRAEEERAHTTALLDATVGWFEGLV